MSYLTEEQLEEVADKFSRFKEAPWFRTEPLDIIIGGCGGIGSWTSLLLSRQAHNLYLFDDDRVENLNLGNQLFRHSDVGENKTQAVTNVIRDLSGQDNIEQYELYTSESISGPIMISCFDNMKARKVMFDNWVNYVKTNPEDNCIFIDGRLKK
jgi:tRNA A37 threonylcarbamoyladenosine dehydratase